MSQPVGNRNRETESQSPVPQEPRIGPIGRGVLLRPDLDLSHIDLYVSCNLRTIAAPRQVLSKKLHSLPSPIRRIIQTRGHSWVEDRWPSRRAAYSVGSLYRSAPCHPGGRLIEFLNTDANRHDDIAHTGSSGFGGNVDSAEVVN